MVINGGRACLFYGNLCECHAKKTVCRLHTLTPVCYQLARSSKYKFPMVRQLYSIQVNNYQQSQATCTNVDHTFTQTHIHWDFRQFAYNSLMVLFVLKTVSHEPIIHSQAQAHTHSHKYSCIRTYMYYLQVSTIVNLNIACVLQVAIFSDQHNIHVASWILKN